MPVLGYWDIRGLGQHVRLLLKFVGEDFEDKFYVTGDAPNYNKDSWLNEKYNLNLDFPNLPYYIDGDVRLTQSNAIMRYIARKHKLDGATEEEKVRVDVLTEECMDIRMAYVKFSYEDFPDPQYIKNACVKLKRLEAFLGSNEWFAGKNITFVDFIVYELLDVHQIIDAACLDPTPNLKAFHSRFEALPEMKAYMNSDKFMFSPLNNRMAKFNN